MRKRRRRWRRIALLFIVFAAAFLGVQTVIARSNEAQNAPKTPVVHLSVDLNGKPLTSDAGDVVHITPEDELTPRVDVDWQGRKPGSLTLTWGSREVQIGEKIRPKSLGMSSLRARAAVHTPKGDLVGLDETLFRVGAHRQFPAMLTVVKATREDSPDSEDAAAVQEVVVRVSSDAFDVGTIDLATVSLWLLDAEFRPLDCLELAPADESAAGAVPEFAESQEGRELRFVRSAGASPAVRGATQVRMIGSARRDGESIDFETSRAALPGAAPQSARP